MFGFRYAKVPPTTYVMHFSGGRVKREGAGLSFFYWAPTATLVQIPLASAALPFAFTDVTADFQTVTFQGQLVYRVAAPATLAAFLDFTVRPNGAYRTDAPAKLADRLIQTVEVSVRSVVHGMTLRDALVGSQRVATEVVAIMRASDTVRFLGLEILDVTLLSARPSPETARALEAEAREALLRNADEAIYARRNAAVEEERKIKESELNTQIAVEQKNREIREVQMSGEIAVEEQRAAFIARKAQNDRIDSDSRAYAIEATLKPYKDADWKTLAALGGADARTNIAIAFRELAENATKIGELNITPDLLRTLLAAPAPAGVPTRPTTSIAQGI